MILTAILAAGCAKEIENTLDERNSTAIELSSVCTGPMTKAVITGATFTSEEANAGIGLFLLDGNGDTYANNGGNVKYAFSSTEAKWTATDPLSVGGTAGKLYGYYPFNSSVKDIASVPVESSVNGTDYLYASPVEVTSSNAKDVSLTLNHALARVSMSFKLDESYAGNGSLSGVSLSGDCVAAKGTMNAIDGGIDATASKFTASGLDQTISKTASTTVECLVVPVSATGDAELKVACTIDGKAYATTFTGDIAALAQGKQTTINLTVRNTSIVVDATSVHVWDENGDQNDTVGGQYTVTIVYSSDAGIKDDVWIQNVIVGEDSAVVTARSFSGRRLKCTMPDGEFCTSQSKTGNLVYTFTISDITENTTATIGYAEKVSNIGVTPDGAGSVIITGDAYEGETVTLTAIPAYEYGFDAWLDKDGDALSCEEETYKNVRLSLDGMSVRFKGNLVLGGEFSVASGKKVRFTRGNLYRDTEGCKVEQHQYDYNSGQWTSPNAHVSHFMWCNNIMDATRQGYSTAMNGQSPFFTEVDGFTVSGFSKNQCRTLTTEEWQYLFSYDATGSGGKNYDNDVRRGKYKLEVTVCGKDNCIVLLPDNWTGGTIERSYDYVGWKHMEAAGAVCLPAAGYRDGSNGNTHVDLAGSYGYYWSASSSGGNDAFDLYFGSGNVDPNRLGNRRQAYSVRLVTESK